MSVVVLVWVGSLVFACGDDAAPTPDAGATPFDAGHDGGSDGGTDAGLDAASCDDDNPCTVDGVERGACTHVAGNAGAVCRPVAMFCDLEETCTGLDTDCPADATQPARLYATTGGISEGTLHVIDPTDATTVTTIGPTGNGITGIAFHPRTGVLYGVTTRFSVGVSQTLVTIEPATGATETVGPMGCTIADIAFAPNGTLYGWVEQIGRDEPVIVDDLATISLETGSVTIVADSGIETYGSGLAFGPDDRLYFAGATSSGNLVIIDPELGIVRGTVGMLEGRGFSVAALEFDFGGSLFAIENNRGEGQLLRIDPATAATTTIGPLDVFRLDGLAFGCR